MVDNKIINIGEHVNKKDLELILEVNRKSIEIETEMVNQNEEVLSLLLENKKSQEKNNDKIDKIIKQIEEMNKDIFKIQALFVTGIISLIVQFVSIFIKNK